MPHSESVNASTGSSKLLRIVRGIPLKFRFVERGKNTHDLNLKTCFAVKKNPHTNRKTTDGSTEKAGQVDGEVSKETTTI